MNQNPQKQIDTCEKCGYVPTGNKSVDINHVCISMNQNPNTNKEDSCEPTTPFRIKDLLNQERINAQKELSKEIMELQEDQPGEYGHGYDYAFQEIHTLLTSKHLLD